MVDSDYDRPNEDEDVGVERSEPSKAQQQVAAYFRNIQDIVRDDMHQQMAEIHHAAAQDKMDTKIRKMHSLARKVGVGFADAPADADQLAHPFLSPPLLPAGLGGS